MIIFPYRTDSLIKRMPIVNFIITSVLLLLSLLFYYGLLNASVINSLILSRWGIMRMIGSVLIQPNLISIVFISLFLLLIGNSVNSVAGNIYYPILFIFFCIVFSSVHLLTSDVRAIGANGVVAGFAGFAFAILPSNKLIIFKSETEEEEGLDVFTIVFLWILFSIYSVLDFPSIPSLLSQLASFISGIVSALLLVKFKVIKTIDPTFPEWLNDKVALLARIDIMGAVMPRSKKIISDDAVKSKAEKLMNLIEDQENNFTPPEALNEPLPEPALGTEIKFRLLKGIKQKGLIILYFAFEGKEISGISIESPNVKCEIFPSEILKPGDSGSIKIYSSKNDIVHLFVSYTLLGVPTTKEIVYSATSNEIIK